MSLVSGIASLQLVSGGVTRDLSVSTDLITVFVESKDMDLDDPGILKFIETLVLELKNQLAQTALQVIVKYRDNPFEDHRVGDTVNVSAGGPVHVRPPGARYLCLRIEDTAVKSRWSLTRITVYGTAAGRRF